MKLRFPCTARSDSDGNGILAANLCGVARQQLAFAACSTIAHVGTPALLPVVEEKGPYPQRLISLGWKLWTVAGWALMSRRSSADSAMSW